MDYQLIMKKQDGSEEVVAQGDLKSSNVLNETGNFKIPRIYEFENIEDNKEIYSTLLTKIGDNVVMESDKFEKGLFNVSHKEGKIILNEIIS